jgi:hypothetical protein
MQPLTHRSLVTLALTAGLVLTGCGGTDDAPTAAPAADDAIVVRLVDFGFVDLPAQVEPGTRLTVVNEAEAELHELVAFALPDTEDRSVQELTALSPAELVGTLGEPVTVLLAEPGGPEIPAVGDGTLTEPGRYAIMCFIPTGVEPAEYLRVAAETEEGPPQVDGGPPHFVNGMYGEVVVG